MTGETAGLHVVVSGRVQGVGFRAFVYENASNLGLTGWVRNKGDDEVEVWAEGPRQDLDRLLILLHSGPSMAYVSNVQASRPDPEGKYTHFMVISSTW